MNLIAIGVVVIVLYAFTARRRLQWAVKRMVVAGDVPSRPIDVVTELEAREHFVSVPCACKRVFLADELRAATVRFADESRYVLRAECLACTQSYTRYYRVSRPADVAG